MASFDQGELQRMVESMQEGAEEQGRVLGRTIKHAGTFTLHSEAGVLAFPEVRVNLGFEVSPAMG